MNTFLLQLSTHYHNLYKSLIGNEFCDSAATLDYGKRQLCVYIEEILLTSDLPVKFTRATNRSKRPNLWHGSQDRSLITFLLPMYLGTHPHRASTSQRENNYFKYMKYSDIFLCSAKIGNKEISKTSIVWQTRIQGGGGGAACKYRHWIEWRANGLTKKLFH